MANTQPFDKYISELVTDIFDPTTQLAAVPGIIQRYVQKKPEYEVDLYTQLSKALMERKKVFNQLESSENKIQIISRAGGVIRLINPQAAPLYPIAIISKKNVISTDIIAELNNIIKDVHDFEDRKIAELKYKNEKLKDKTEIILRHEISNEGWDYIEFIKGEQDTIAANDVIGYLRNREITSVAKSNMDKYYKAKFYCEGRINKLTDDLETVLQIDNRVECVEVLCKLFYKKNIRKAEQIIELLRKEITNKKVLNLNLDLNRPFINLDEYGYACWDCSINSSISYLAGMIIVCQGKGWINTNLPLDKLRTITNEVFNTDIRSNTAFQRIKNGKTETKYTNIFEILFSDIS